MLQSPKFMKEQSNNLKGTVTAVFGMTFLATGILWNPQRKSVLKKIMLGSLV